MARTLWVYAKTVVYDFEGELQLLPETKHYFTVELPGNPQAMITEKEKDIASRQLFHRLEKEILDVHDEVVHPEYPNIQVKMMEYEIHLLQ